MRCHNHQPEEAVTSCQCGRSLCKDCSERYEPMACEKCALESIHLQRWEIYRDFIVTGLIFACGFAIAADGPARSTTGHGGVWPGFMIGYVYAGARAGWIALTKITASRSSRTVFAFPIISWMVAQFLKLIVSAFIGAVLLPIRVVQQAFSLRRLSFDERYLTSDRNNDLRLVHSTVVRIE